MVGPWAQYPVFHDKCMDLNKIIPPPGPGTYRARVAPVGGLGHYTTTPEVTFKPGVDRQISITCRGTTLNPSCTIDGK